MWVDKYAPITWAGFVGNDAATRQCKQWVQHFKTLLLATETLPSDRVLLLSGPEGVGKTSAAMLLLTTAGFDVNRFTMQEIRNHKKDTDLLSNFCHL
jgi:replication factor C subunit 1